MLDLRSCRSRHSILNYMFSKGWGCLFCCFFFYKNSSLPHLPPLRFGSLASTWRARQGSPGHWIEFNNPYWTFSWSSFPPLPQSSHHHCKEANQQLWQHTPAPLAIGWGPLILRQTNSHALRDDSTFCSCYFLFIPLPAARDDFRNKISSQVARQ